MSQKTYSLPAFPHILIVEASAGSGKTYRLAKRYLQLLINPALAGGQIPLNTILAITFTNKAAQEMKGRILEFLKEIALDAFTHPQEKNDIISSLGIGEQAAREAAYRTMDFLIKNYNFFQVQTIDSFINAILSGCAFKLNLSASFKTERDYLQYVWYSLDSLIKRAADDEAIARLFHNFLRQYIYIENKRGWFPKQDIIAIITSLYSKSNRYPGTFVRSAFEPKDVIALKKKILGLMREFSEDLPEGTNKRFVQSLATFLEQNREGFDIDSLSGFFAHETVPVKSGTCVESRTKQRWERIRKDLHELCQKESVSAYNYYIDIFHYVLDELDARSSHEDVLFLEALNKQARRLFEEQSLGLPELYYRLAIRFKHFLLDEFQDTSTLQWENLFAMIEEALSTDGSLFYVGDRKQAIYRFRGGEVSLIDSVKQRFQGITVFEESLTTNYRSEREIVEFNNLIFSEANLRRFLQELCASKKDYENPLQPDADEVIRIFKGSVQQHVREKDRGFVRLEFFDLGAQEERGEVLRGKLFSLITDLRSRFRLQDIAFLVRKNEEVEQLSTWLLEQGIPVESEKTLTIRHNAYIKELVSYLKFLNSPIDNLSFASFVLGDIFCRASGLHLQEIQDFIFGLARKKQKPLYLYREFRQAFPRAWDAFIEEFFRSVGFIPLYELVVSILARLQCVKAFPEYQGFFMRFLELVKAQEPEVQSIGCFLEFFEEAADDELYVKVTEGNAVKIMTIHKAKGLEFPCVVIPMLEMNVKPDSEVVIPNTGGLGLLYLKRKYAQFSPEHKAVLQAEYQKSFIDELNSVYVATTRAIDELYIFVSPKISGIFHNPAALLFPEKNFSKGKKRAPTNQMHAHDAHTMEIPPSDYGDWIPLLKDEWQDAATPELKDKILRGEILHSILSRINTLSMQDEDSVVRQALEKARAAFPFYPYDFEEFEKTITRILKDKELRQYFELKDGRVVTEQELVNAFGETLRVDRVIVTPKEVIVLDYKSSRQGHEEHRAQMLKYMELFRDIHPKAKIRGIVVYLDELTTEEIDGTRRDL